MLGEVRLETVVVRNHDLLAVAVYAQPGERLYPLLVRDPVVSSEDEVRLRDRYGRCFVATMPNPLPGQPIDQGAEKLQVDGRLTFIITTKLIDWKKSLEPY